MPPDRVPSSGIDFGADVGAGHRDRAEVGRLMAEILDSHLREEFTQVAADPKIRKQHQKSIDEVIALVRSYLK